MKEILLFTSPSCGACVTQEKILHDYFRSKGKRAVINKINVDRFPGKFPFIQFTPTWAFPQGNQKYALYPSIIDDPKMIESVKSTSFGKRKSRFGEKTLLPGINDLEVYGKNFPNGQGFSTPKSFYGTVEDVWGKGYDTLNAGIGGTRSLGPDRVGEIFSNDYVNNIRMAHPSDQLGTALNLNRTCNTKGSVLESPGLIYDSKNPQIVSSTTGFGRKSRFGNLYSQMGPASEIGNQYLINKDTGKQLYSGARQDELPRPYSVKTGYVGQATEYKPKLSFGKKSKKVKKCLKLVKKCNKDVTKCIKTKKSESSLKKCLLGVKCKKAKKCFSGEGAVLRLTSKNNIKINSAFGKKTKKCLKLVKKCKKDVAKCIKTKKSESSLKKCLLGVKCKKAKKCFSGEGAVLRLTSKNKIKVIKS